MLRFTVMLTAEFEGPSHDAFDAAAAAARAGLEVSWIGADDSMLRFVARPPEALSWVRAMGIVQDVSVRSHLHAFTDGRVTEDPVRPSTSTCATVPGVLTAPA